MTYLSNNSQAYVICTCLLRKLIIFVYKKNKLLCIYYITKYKTELQ